MARPDPAPSVVLSIRCTPGEAQIWKRLARAHGKTASSAFGSIIRGVDRAFQAKLRPHQRELYIADELSFDDAQEAKAGYGFRRAAAGAEPYASIAAGKPIGAAPLPNGANGHAAPAPRLRQGPVPPPGASFMAEHGDQFIGAGKLAEYAAAGERDEAANPEARLEREIHDSALRDDDAA
jgi:hypothetical protein